MCILYPGTLAGVVSGTARQAAIVLEKISTYFINYEAILYEIDSEGHAPFKRERDKLVCRFKNGSKVEPIP